MGLPTSLQLGRESDDGVLLPPLCWWDVSSRREYLGWDQDEADPEERNCSRRYHGMNKEMFHKRWLSVFALGWRSTPTTTPAFAPASSILQQGGTTWSTSWSHGVDLVRLL